ncbi:MAG: 4-alpha-glucanotransferase [Planctomycetota bacterium]|nr:MAG: 4-alpha-glucanotransferase [Planctomycetota bacterium]
MKTPPEFDELLWMHRVQPSFLDVNNRRRQATPEALMALLRSLGANIDRPEHAGELLREAWRARLSRGVEPVLVAWDGRLSPIELTLPAGASGTLQYWLELEDHRLSGSLRLDSLSRAPLANPAGLDYGVVRLPVHEHIPTGYHRLRLQAGDRQFEALVISAPRRTYSEGQLPENRASVASAGRPPRRAWGTFMPLYALRREADWGVGDFSSLARLGEWTGGLGGSAIGTLPLLASSLDEPFEPSPYRPVSRQFWNELYIDVEATPEWQRSATECAPAASDERRRRIQQLKQAKLVDYREAMALKRPVLAELASQLFQAKSSDRFQQFQRFVADNPLVESYAKFRAAMDRRSTGWTAWPASMHARLEEGDYDIADHQYHLYVQWIAAEQLQNVKEEAGRAGCGLYLDLPVGVDPGGFDVWQNQALFVAGASTGAPPDPFFTKGQDWGLPPLHPERIRDSGYAHLRAVLAANMRYARYLRIDHAMGWHRLYFIPPGMRADQGAYVRYHADEFYAVASVESHRWHCTLLAENMGTVPPEVGEALDEHGVGGMWVAPYELEPSRRHALNEPPPLSVASLNTHDMPPAAAWWRGDDIDDRLSLGLMDQREAESQRADRLQAIEVLRQWLRDAGFLPLAEDARRDAPPIVALLRALACSPAQLVLITLEDLWLETEPQNIPGTLYERPNWRRKARYSLEQFTRMPEVVDALSQISGLRARNESLP